MKELLRDEANKGMPSMLYADACYRGKGMPHMGV